MRLQYCPAVHHTIVVLLELQLSANRSLQEFLHTQFPGTLLLPDLLPWILQLQQPQAVPQNVPSLEPKRDTDLKGQILLQAVCKVKLPGWEEFHRELNPLQQTPPELLTFC